MTYLGAIDPISDWSTSYEEFPRNLTGLASGIQLGASDLRAFPSYDLSASCVVCVTSDSGVDNAEVVIRHVVEWIWTRSISPLDACPLFVCAVTNDVACEIRLILNKNTDVSFVAMPACV